MANLISTRKRRLIVLVLLLITVAGVVALLWVTNVFGWRVWRVQEAQTFIGAALPVTASDVQFSTRSQYGRIIWLRFSLPPDADVSAFITAMGITEPLKRDFTPFPAANPQEAALTWWQPTSSTIYSGLYWNTGAKIIEMLLDSTDSSKQVVYLRAYAIGRG